MNNILSFDLEDWYNLLDHPSVNDDSNWASKISRIEVMTDFLLQILSDSNKKATFFCLGWLADNYPHVLRRIHDEGHELGSHSYSHRLAFKQSKLEFKSDVSKSISSIADAIGSPIKYYRAPGFSIIKNNFDYLEVLILLGITVDSSIFPIEGSHGGFPELRSNGPFRINFETGSVIELPLNHKGFLGLNYVYSGGGYFRLLPYWLIKHNFSKSIYNMTYFHPRDFDCEQPIFPDLSYFRKFKSYVGISSCANKFSKLLSDFEFQTVGDYVSSIKNIELIPCVNADLYVE